MSAWGCQPKLWAYCDCPRDALPNRVLPRMRASTPARPQVRHLRVGVVFALFGTLAACGAPTPACTATADIVKVPGAWSYCEPATSVLLSKENHDVLESDALHARSDAPYDVLVVPGYTPRDAKKPMERVHPIAAARLDEAVSLYRAGVANLVLVSGANVSPVGTPHTEALAMKQYLLEHGISESAIVLEPCARHSTTNLRNAGRFMLKYHLRTALVVTSADQAFYFANGRISSFEIRSRTELGYMVGSLKNLTSTTIVFAPSVAVLQRGSDVLDP
jgi:hypothetical protein